MVSDQPMARPLRIEYPGAIYQRTSRGNARERIFLEDANQRIFLDVFGAVLEKYNWLCHAFCFSPVSRLLFSVLPVFIRVWRLRLARTGGQRTNLKGPVERHDRGKQMHLRLPPGRCSDILSRSQMGQKISQSLVLPYLWGGVFFS